GKAINITAKHLAHDLLLVLPNGTLVIDRNASEFRVKISKGLFVRGIDVKATRLVEKVVAGGAIDGPLFAQLLTRFENLFPQYPDVRRFFPETLEVLAGIA